MRSTNIAPQFTQAFYAEPATTPQAGPSSVSNPQPGHVFYDPRIHSSHEHFRNLPTYAQFKKEYSALLDGLVAFYREHADKITPPATKQEVRQLRYRFNRPLS